MSRNGITNFPYQGKVLGVDRTGRYMLPLGVATKLEGGGEKLMVYLEISDPRKNTNDGRLTMVSAQGVHHNVSEGYFTVLDSSPFGSFSVDEYIAVFMSKVNTFYLPDKKRYVSILGYGSFNMVHFAFLYDGTNLFYSRQELDRQEPKGILKHSEILRKLNK